MHGPVTRLLLIETLGKIPSDMIRQPRQVSQHPQSHSAHQYKSSSVSQTPLACACEVSVCTICILICTCNLSIVCLLSLSYLSILKTSILYTLLLPLLPMPHLVIYMPARGTLLIGCLLGPTMDFKLQHFHKHAGWSPPRALPTAPDFFSDSSYVTKLVGVMLGCGTVQRAVQ